MTIHAVRLPVLILSCLVMLIACEPSEDFSFFPTGEEIEADLIKKLSAVNGDWTGQSFGPENVWLQFTLMQNGQQVTGRGGYQDAKTPDPIPITMAGTFMRPRLSLTFDGIIIEGVRVAAQFEGNYVTIGGIGDFLILTGEGFSEQIHVLLQEDLDN